MTKRSDFEWDAAKDLINQEKHGVSFALAQLAFLDQYRVILEDMEHSFDENRYYSPEEIKSLKENLRAERIEWLHAFTDLDPVIKNIFG